MSLEDMMAPSKSYIAYIHPPTHTRNGNERKLTKTTQVSSARLVYMKESGPL